MFVERVAVSDPVLGAEKHSELSVRTVVVVVVVVIHGRQCIEQATRIKFNLLYGAKFVCFWQTVVVFRAAPRAWVIDCQQHITTNCLTIGPILCSLIR